MELTWVALPREMVWVNLRGSGIVLRGWWEEGVTRSHETREEGKIFWVLTSGPDDRKDSCRRRVSWQFFVLRLGAGILRVHREKSLPRWKSFKPVRK